MKNKISQIGTLATGLLAVVALLVGCSSMAQAGGGGTVASVYAGGSTEIPYTISVNGTGIAVTTPDVADVRFGVESIHADAAAALNDNNAKMAAVMEAIKGLSIADEDVQTSEYTMWIDQAYDPERGLPSGEVTYHVSNQVSVRVRDIGQVGALLEAVLQAGANNIGGITFGVDDATALQSQARKEALANARAKAEELAAGLGVKVGKVRQVSEYSSAPSTPVLMRESMDMVVGAGGAGVSVASGSYNVTMDVYVVFDIIQ